MAVLFSIIIPCYNQAHFLSDCLESVIEQDFPDWEAIVVNDGSTDNTEKIANTYKINDSRIKYVAKQNGGLSSARNVGMQQASGSRIIFLDADDLLYSDCLTILSKHPKIGDDFALIQYGYSYVTEQNQKILQTVFPAERKQLISDVFSNILAPCHSVCISRKLVSIAGGFDESLKSLEDWDFWIRVAKVGATHTVIQKPLVYYRYVKNSMSRDAFTMFESYKIVAQRAIKLDSRIAEASPLNKEYNVDMSQVLQRALMTVLGVSIMQNKIEESISLFKKETKTEIEKINPIDFEPMCSYLSFRYWYDKDEIEMVFSELLPRFELFFERIGFNKKFIKQATYFIFKRHLFFRNKNKFGNPIGSLINYFLRQKYAV